MVKGFILVATLILPLHAFSACYIAGEFQGKSAKAAEGYEFGDDGFSGREIRIEVSGEASTVSGSEDLDCRRLSGEMITCTYSSSNEATVETWSIDAERGVVLYTKHAAGFPFGLSGVTSLKGRLLRSCDG